MFEPNLLRDRVILITGGGTGIGRAMANRFSSLGAAVALLGRRADLVQQAASEIAADGGVAHAISCNVRDPDAVEAAVKEVCEQFGRIDAVVNNAAGNIFAKTEDLTPNAFASVIGTVLLGTIHVTLAAGRRMIAQKHGAILNMLAGYAQTGAPFVVPSACAKAGVHALTRSLAVEWARHGIRVNAIAPGSIQTEGAWKAIVPSEALAEAAKLKIPLRRFGETSEVANLAAFLLSDAAPYINGATVWMDGGEWMTGGQFSTITSWPSQNIDSLFEMMGAARKRKAQ
jgi:NAD(P)-dependent dehydrogenase (short-subunit alcohol dehydrogenase family)